MSILHSIVYSSHGIVWWTYIIMKPALRETACIQGPSLYKDYGLGRVPIVLVQLIPTSVKRPPPTKITFLRPRVGRYRQDSLHLLIIHVYTV